MQFCLAACTDRGKTRRVNQDGLLLQQALCGRRRYVLAAVCDGMGGLEKGELASSEVLQSLSDWFQSRFPEVLMAGLPEQELLRDWKNLVHTENAKIQAYGAKQGILLGTTLTAALFNEENWYSVHVGDSRLYEITADTVRQLTRDHSLAAEAVERGVITREEGEKDKRRSVLTRCIGACPEVTPEYQRGVLRQDAVYLLCTDGFWHGNAPERLAAAFSPDHLTREKQMLRAAKKVTARNRRYGEKDNISALLVRPLYMEAGKRGRLCWKSGRS